MHNNSSLPSNSCGTKHTHSLAHNPQALKGNYI